MTDRPLTDRLEMTAAEIALVDADHLRDSIAALLREARAALEQRDIADTEVAKCHALACADILDARQQALLLVGEEGPPIPTLRDAILLLRKRAEAAEARAETLSKALTEIVRHDEAIICPRCSRIAREALGGPNKGRDDIPRDAEGLPDDGQDPPLLERAVLALRELYEFLDNPEFQLEHPSVDEPLATYRERAVSNLLREHRAALADRAEETT